MDIFLCCDADEVLEFFFIYIKESHEHLCRLIHIESFAEIRILCRDTDRTCALMTYSVLLTSDTDHSDRRYRDSICTHSDRLRDVGTRAESSRDTESDISTDSLGIEVFASAIYCIWGRDTDIVLDMSRCSTRRSTTTVDGDEVGFTEDRDFEVILDMRGDDLDPYGLAS